MLEHDIAVCCLAGELQIALPNSRRLGQSLYVAVPTFGIWPQQLKSLRLITPWRPAA
jgi:hypothetical protein